jgi:predicted glycoside hydrolase/deacetylase ChbG (UPF0249 family)
MTVAPEFAYLIVNADDYGYFHCVSRGILRSASTGIVTATGVLGNTAHLQEHVKWLRDQDGLDVGVHLNLTDREPLTPDMRKRLFRWGGRFPGKFAVALAVLSGAIKTEDVRLEWKAQIERCLAAGLQARFINSHEHIHMLPPLFAVTRGLAEQHGIPHVRFPTSDLSAAASVGSLLRSSLMTALGALNHRHGRMPAAHFLGMEQSGRLSLRYFERMLPRLRPSRVYELMCHPGYRDDREVHDGRLLRYHDWEGELNTLTSPDVTELLRQHRVRVVGYRHLEVNEGRLAVRQNSAIRDSAT